MSKRFCILSLDGGGIKGTFTAAVLAELERTTHKRVADHFDLIAGTSTGGILAIGLGLGFPAQAILDFYRQRGPILFPATGLLGRTYGLVARLFRPKRNQGVLREQLGQIMKGKKFGDSKCRLVIPAFDASLGRIFLFKTAHSHRFQFDADLEAADVAAATAAAPTYYSAYRVPGNDAFFIDGGVWANCPVLVAVTEAIAFLGQAPADIDVLSIGTTSYPFQITKQARVGGLMAWSRNILETMFRGQEEAARKQADLLIDGHVHRINYDAPPGAFALDDARGIEGLVAIGTNTARLREHLDVVRAKFLNDIPVEPFRPLV